MDLLERYNELKLADIEGFVDSRRQEDLHLDFKLPENGRELTKNDRDTFAKALSGFANSEGGLIVWGVEASKDDDGVDCAKGLKPLKPLKTETVWMKFLNSLKEATFGMVSPKVDGVASWLRASAQLAGGGHRHQRHAHQLVPVELLHGGDGHRGRVQL